MRTPEVVLKDAATLIEQRGWYQGVNGLGFGMGPNGELCVVTAIRKACEPFDFLTLTYSEFHRLYTERWNAVNLMTTRVGGSIATWNDAPERTRAEVLAMLRGEEVTR